MVHPSVPRHKSLIHLPSLCAQRLLVVVFFSKRHPIPHTHAHICADFAPWTSVPEPLSGSPTSGLMIFTRRRESGSGEKRETKVSAKIESDKDLPQRQEKSRSKDKRCFHRKKLTLAKRSLRNDMALCVSQSPHWTQRKNHFFTVNFSEDSEHHTVIFVLRITRVFL